MAETTEEESDSVLSDVEGEDDPVPIDVVNRSSEQDFSPERFREILAELEREKNARKAAEDSKSDLQNSFNRLKILAHEAIKKRDENSRQRDEALRDRDEALQVKYKISSELADVIQLKDEALKQRDENLQLLEEAVKIRDSMKSEIEGAAQLLVSGIDKISEKVNNFKNFSGIGLPRSQKYSGLSAVAYGVIKRTNEIVEELLKQVDTVTKSRNEARELVAHRNYEIAIEVSQLEATIRGLKEEVEKKTSELEDLRKSALEKDGKHSELLEKINFSEKQVLEWREIGQEYESRLKSLESKIDSQRLLLSDQLKHLSKTHDHIYEITRIINNKELDQVDSWECLFVSQGNDIEQCVRATLAGTESIHELAKVALDKVRNGEEEKNQEVQRLNEKIAQLVTEKNHIDTLLRSALSTNMALAPSTKVSGILHMTENGLRDAGLDIQFDDIVDHHEKISAQENSDVSGTEDEVQTLASSLVNIVKASQSEITSLRHSLVELRAESALLNTQLETQAKELNQKKHQIKELEQKLRAADESVEGLMVDIVAAEEEIARWKLAAEQEAAAGRAVEQEFEGKLISLSQELEAAKQTVLVFENKIKFKEETEAAAMAARDAAEKSLRLADDRASRLRERLEELTRQVEESENVTDLTNQTRHRYMCWPWQWSGLNIIGHSTESQQPSNEMELSEPFL